MRSFCVSDSYGGSCIEYVSKPLKQFKSNLYIGILTVQSHTSVILIFRPIQKMGSLLRLEFYIVVKEFQKLKFRIYDHKINSSIGTSGEKGFGLGLKLVGELVTDLHGTMDISSKENEGKEIELKFPLK